ncbi:VanZ family protein [Cohnella pontilimi]|nr:VanZ family protein [Cohnella pontilimi]
MKPVIRSRWLRAFIWLTTVLYGAVLIYLLFIRDRRHIVLSHPNILSWDRPYANLIPFRTIDGYLYHSDLYNFDVWFQVFFGNLVLFLPFGFLAPLLSGWMRSFPRFFIVLLLVLLGVELIQKFTFTGAFDVDDIILNSIGAIVGYILSRLIFRSAKS